MVERRLDKEHTHTRDSGLDWTGLDWIGSDRIGNYAHICLVVYLDLGSVTAVSST